MSLRPSLFFIFYFFTIDIVIASPSDSIGIVKPIYNNSTFIDHNNSTSFCSKNNFFFNLTSTDPKIKKLIDLALNFNQDIRIAKARLDKARGKELSVKNLH